MRRDEHKLLKNISREAGEADARVDERAEGLIVRRNRLLLLNQEEKELVMRPVLPWHVPVHGCCAQTHTMHRVEVGPNALPNRRLPQIPEEANSSVWRKPFPEVLWPETFNTKFPHTSRLYPVPRSDL